MRHFSPMIFVLALSTLAGCASPMATRSRDTAVRAEPRRVSAATAEDPVPATFRAAPRVGLY